jgi:transcriptional regulator with XRE-family HTH domain
MITQEQLGLKIKSLREKFGFTQEFVSKKLGLSRQAIMAMEAGKRSVQSVELAKLASLYKISIDLLLAFELVKNEQHFNKELDIKLDKKKLRNLILYILARCGGKPNVGETVLYKLLYFIDFDSFELSEKSVTGLKYVKLQFGPVPAVREYCSVLDKMVENQEIKIIKQEYHGFPQKKYVALVDSDQSVFVADEIVLINRVISRLSDMSATKIEAYVHEDVPWKATGTGNVIDYRLVFERTAPFAQSDRETLWQSAAGKDAEKDLGPMLQEEYNYYEKL